MVDNVGFRTTIFDSTGEWTTAPAGKRGFDLAQGNMSPVGGAYMCNDFVRDLRGSANSAARSSNGREQAPGASAPTSLTLARGSRPSQLSHGGQQTKVGSTMSGLFVIHHLTPMPSHSGLYNRQIHARRFRERVTAERVEYRGTGCVPWSRPCAARHGRWLLHEVER